MLNVTVPTKTGVPITVPVRSVDEFIAGVNKEALIQRFKRQQGRPNKPSVTWFNSPVTFDIETSQVKNDSDDDYMFSFMYVWTANIAGAEIIGRTWEEFYSLLLFLHSSLELSDRRRLIVFVHNLAYEWQFLHYRFPTESLFSRDVRKPCRWKLGEELTGIEFRCTYILTNKSLERWAAETPSCPIGKQVGDLDYSKIRTEKTVLDDKELSYMVADTLSMYYLLDDMIHSETSKCIGDLPLTKTGFVRRSARRFFGSDPDYRKFYNRLKLNADQFILYNAAFRGGDTHADLGNSMVNHDEVFSFDLTSSYPYRLLIEDFPLSKPLSVSKPAIKDLEWVIQKEYLWVAEVTLCDVELLSFYHQSYLPISKCIRIGTYQSDNGRIIKADCLSIALTSVDWDIVVQNYSFRIVSVNQLVYHVKKGLLPEPFRKFVIQLYRDKTRYKGDVYHEDEYRSAKEDINSIYGMCVTNPLNDEILFDLDVGEWEQDVLRIDLSNRDKIQAELDRVYKSRNHFLPYEIGVFVTAYARSDLHTALRPISMDGDTVYWDTDSCKFNGREHRDLFYRLNEVKENRLLSVYDLDEVAPEDIHGVRHMIGLWDEETDDKGLSFTTFGAKKYFYTVNSTGENHVTVAGMGKQAVSFIEKMAGQMGKAFIETPHIGMTIPDEYSGRTVSHYFEEEHIQMVDGVLCHEYSYMTIEPTTYTLGVTEDYKMVSILAKESIIKER